MLSLVNLDKAQRFQYEFHSCNGTTENGYQNNTQIIQRTALAMISGPRYILQNRKCYGSAFPAVIEYAVSVLSDFCKKRGST